MEDSSILEMIRNKDSKSAMKEMETIFRNMLIEKLTKHNSIDTKFEEKDFMMLLDFCIINLKQYYDILTYLRNLYFFSDKSDSEKLYELAYIYEVLAN